MKTIDISNVLLFHSKIVAKTGGSDGIRDVGLIESALSRAFITFDGKELYPETERKVAVITFGLIRNLRPLGIHAFLDRIIQECLRIVLEPIVEARFFPNSYGFRPCRATKHAVKDITTLISGSKINKPIYAIEVDIKGYFDNINHRLLLKKLWKLGVHDKRVLSIINEMLKAGYIERINSMITGLTQYHRTAICRGRKETLFAEI